MGKNVLKNAGLEYYKWDKDERDKGHTCLVLPFPYNGEAPRQILRGECNNPVGWTEWHMHGEDVTIPWDSANNLVAEPESRGEGKIIDPLRIAEGENVYLMFTSCRIHIGGLFQRAFVGKGNLVKATFLAHAWYNEDQKGDPRESTGMGTLPFYALAGEDGLTDKQKAYEVRVGIDPTGGTNPMADTVVWGRAAHIYNVPAYVPEVEVVAEDDEVTFFTFQLFRWPAWHCNGYVDACIMEVTEDEEEPQIPPPVELETEYKRVFNAWPAGTSLADAHRILDAVWANQESLGGSWDDAYQTLQEDNTVVLWGIAESDKEKSREWFAARSANTRVIFKDLPEEVDEIEEETNWHIEDAIPRLPVNTASPWYPWKKRDLSEISHVFVHHSAGRLTSDFDDIVRIAEYHCYSSKNRPGICYTFVIGADGTTYQTASINDVVFSQGSSSYPGDENRFGVGVCLLGTFMNGVEPTEAQKEALDNLINHLEGVVGHELKVFGHKDVIATACPGDWWPPADKPSWGKQGSQIVIPVTPPQNDSVAPLKAKNGPKVGLHVQSLYSALEDAVLQLTKKGPAVFKTVENPGMLTDIKLHSPETITVYRKYLTSEFQSTHVHSDPEGFAELFFNSVKPDLERYGDCIDLVQGLNEVCARDDVKVAVRFAVRFADLIRMLGNELVERHGSETWRVRPLLLAIPVGNPELSQFEDLIPAAEAAIRAGGAIDYRTYWPVATWRGYSKDWFAEDFPWYHGRFQMIDDYLCDNDLFVSWLAGEAGAVYMDQTGGLEASLGWKYKYSYGGDKPRDAYINDIARFEEMLKTTRAYADGRFLGYCLFTSGNNSTGWDSFQVRESEIEAIINTLF